MYFGTRYVETSLLRKLIIVILFLLFAGQCIGAIPMIILFDKNSSCFDFYKHTDKTVMLLTFCCLCMTYLLEAVFITIVLCTYLFCSERQPYYHFS